MKSKFLCLVLAACASFSISQAADPAAATASDTLNATYVEGVRLISDTNAAIERENRVLSIVEQGADGQGDTLSAAEYRLQAIKSAAGDLELSSARQVQAGIQLMAERNRLDARFKALEAALLDEKTILLGATQTVDALLNAADKSGKLAERQLADQAARDLKAAAERLRNSSDQLAQFKLRISLEHTLLQGLQSRASAEGGDISALKSEVVKIEKLLAEHRGALERLSNLLVADRTGLSKSQNAFGQGVEVFRVVQVAVLRHWLIDGPPAGEMPTFTIDEVMEPMAPVEASSGYLRTNSVAGGRVGVPEAPALGSAGKEARYGYDGNGDPDTTQASAEVIQLHRKARWYLSMLSRLTSFAQSSIEESSNWVSGAESWRNQLNSSGRTLANQRGALTSLAMEQGIVATTVELMTKQATTAREQVNAVVVQVGKQTKRLEEISTELKKQADKL